MEAIVCPNCGNNRMEMLTEEKYRCLACDNEILIHNLSKEFRQTDAHISDMQQDLKNLLQEVGNLNRNTTIINTVSDNTTNGMKTSVKTTYDVELTDAGSNKVKVIKVVREITGLGLAETKELVESAPKIIKKAMQQSDAEHIQTMLKREGAKVTLK